MCRDLLAGVLILLCGFGAAEAAEGSATGAAATVAQRFERLRDDPSRLRMFLAAMPKGGDLHNHLDGAVYAESFLAHARESGLCIDMERLALRPPPCSEARPPAAAALAADRGLWNRMVDALSMRDFVPTDADRSGHDHFFASFDRFGAAADDRGAMLAEEAMRAAGEHVLYLEIIALPRLRDAIAIGLGASWKDDDLQGDLDAISDKLAALIPAARQETDRAEARMRTLLGCGASPGPAACRVIIRYQGFTLRTLPPRAVFAQAAFAAMLTKADPRYVGVNIVAPEDDPVALADYTLHMRMLRFLKRRDPALHLSLHAGELAPGLVPPEALRSHIRQAVEVAGAERIGHGTDIAEEDDAAGLMREMAARHITVEINATSNAQILGVKGRDHPFGLYRAYGVPAVISTDDEGVERIDMTREYIHAARTWQLGYPELKQLSRASLQDSFLASDDKVRALERLDQDFKSFETAQASP